MILNCLDCGTITFPTKDDEFVPNLILVYCEEDESVRIEGLDLHGDGQVARVVVPDVPLHSVSGTVEGVARVFDDLIIKEFLQFCWF